MSFKNRLEYLASLRRLASFILWCVGTCIPDIQNRRFSAILVYISSCALLFQLYMVFVHVWGSAYFHCCHFVADSAMLLRLLYPSVLNINACLYQIYFLLSITRIKKLLKELDKVIAYKATAKGCYKALPTLSLLVILSMSCLLFSRISSCAIKRNWALAYKVKPKICYQIYYITSTPPMDKLFFTWLYTKLILQIITMSLSVLGITFSEFWMGNIFRMLATAFEESHDSLIPLLKAEAKARAKKKKRQVQSPDKPFNPSDDWNTGAKFSTWKKQHFKIRLAVKRADSVLSPLALLHILATPILLCLGEFQLLQKNQEPFMRHYDSKIISYYLIVFSLFRLWMVCNAGEELATQVSMQNGETNFLHYGLIALFW